MVDELRHWDLDDEVRDSALACDVDLSCALDLARQEQPANDTLPSIERDGSNPSMERDGSNPSMERDGSNPSTPPAALAPPDDDADPSVR